MHKAITIALITRDRLGNVFQVNSLLVVEENNNTSKADDEQQQEQRVRTSTGIQIILSRSPLDKNDVGYEKPKPKGFAY